MLRTLGIDVDSTIYDLTPGLIEAAQEITGEEVTKEQINEWGYLDTRFGGDTAHRIFVRALDPKRVSERTLYPGAREIIRVLGALGAEVHFVTHNHDPEGMRPHLVPWLEQHFPRRPVHILHSSESKLECLRDIGAVGIIDDKPATLIEVADAGLVAATLIQPWNRELVESREDIVGFFDWRHILCNGQLLRRIFGT